MNNNPLKSLLGKARFFDPLYPEDITDDVRKTFLGMNPDKILHEEMEASIYRVQYTYVTARGRHMEATKFLALPKTELPYSAATVEKHLKKVLRRVGKDKPYRKVMDVALVQCEPYANAII